MRAFYIMKRIIIRNECDAIRCDKHITTRQLKKKQKGIIF